MRPQKIRVLNPIPDGSRWTGRNRAERYVRGGRAVFVGPNAIRFIAADGRNGAAHQRAIEAAAGYDRSSSTGLASIEEIKNLPVAGDPIILLTRGSSRRGPRGRNGAVRIVVCDGEQVA